MDPGQCEQRAKHSSGDANARQDVDPDTKLVWNVSSPNTDTTIVAVERRAFFVRIARFAETFALPADQLLGVTV